MAERRAGAEVTRVVLTGATGFVGRRIAGELAEGGHDVVAIGRRAEEGPWRSFVPLDVGDDTATWPIREHDVVVHAAGIAHDLSGRGVDDSEYHRVNAIGTRNAARATRSGGGRAFVLLSTVKVYGDRTSEAGVHERALEQPSSAYGHAKLAGERLADDLLRGSEIPYTVLRLNPVYGPGAKGNLERLVRLSRRRLVPWLPRRSGRRSMIHVDDVARLVAQLVTRPIPGIFIVDDGNTYTAREIQELCRGRDRPPWEPVVPAAVLRAAGRIGSIASRAGRVPFTSADASRLLDHAVYLSDRLPTALEWRPLHTLAQALLEDAVETDRDVR